MATRFSQHYKCGKSQFDLDFVDILLDADLPLYVDPYAFKIGVDDWSVECNNLVIDFFEQVIQGIKNRNFLRVRQLLAQLGEPNNTRLGVSSNQPQGRGVGRTQADDLFNRLKGSKAVQTGVLEDLSDCELFIPGIGPDKISDITINIIRGKLAEFTTEQCDRHGIKTQLVAAGVAWNPDQKFWVAGYARLPVYRNTPILLVPKVSVRWRIAADDREYYEHFVLNFLKQEHLDSNSSLVKVLKNGRRIVTKKSVKETITYTKDYLREFSEQHPDIFARYKRTLADKNFHPDDRFLEALIKAVAEGRWISITNIAAESLHMGDTNEIKGDNFGAVGRGNTVSASNLSVFKNAVKNSALDPDMRAVLVKVRDAIEELDKDQEKQDATEALDKLKVELEKPDKDQGRIKRYAKNIADILPSAVSIFGQCQTLYRMIHG